MSVIFLLIIVSVSLAICFLAAFLWAVRSGQYEDDYSPSVRILFEDEAPSTPTISATHNHENTNS